jgi:hypothetical protein
MRREMNFYRDIYISPIYDNGETLTALIQEDLVDPPDVLEMTNALIYVGDICIDVNELDRLCNFWQELSEGGWVFNRELDGAISLAESATYGRNYSVLAWCFRHGIRITDSTDGFSNIIRLVFDHFVESGSVVVVPGFFRLLVQLGMDINKTYGGPKTLFEVIFDQSSVLETMRLAASMLRGGVKFSKSNMNQLARYVESKANMDPRTGAFLEDLYSGSVPIVGSNWIQVQGLPEWHDELALSESADRP